MNSVANQHNHVNPDHGSGYSELQVTSNFSFLRGGSHPEELVLQAVALGYPSLAITDRNTLAGIVRAHVEAKKHNIRFIPACRLDLLDGPSLLAYPTDTESYSRLSALLSLGNEKAEKGQCHLYKAQVYQHARGLKFIAVPPSSLSPSFELADDFKLALREYKEALGNQLYLGATCTYTGDDTKKLYRLNELARRLNLPLVATNDVHYHNAERRELQDVLTCIREKCTIYNAGYRLCQNAERFLKPAEEMKRLFEDYPDAILRTQEIAEACQFSLDSLKYVYPKEVTTKGRTPQQELTKLTWDGARRQYDGDIPEKIREALLYELRFIKRKNYPAYFLTVHDFVRFARDKKILCQGRGSAANSVVCFCLGITSVDPTKFRLLFARFMSDERNEPPDIDVDFEHERREEVMQYIYQKYKRDRAAIVATVTQVHQKGAVRDVAKAMGMSVDAIDRLAASGSGWSDDPMEQARVTEQGFNLANLHLKKVLELTAKYIGFPRQLGQHTGGFVITQNKLSDLCPILNARMKDRTCVEWNKDDIEALGFMKVDVLALGMLTCIRKAFDLAKRHHNKDYTLANILKQQNKRVYRMIKKADTIGVFQIESRAQMSMLPRLKPKKFYDLVIEVAIVRPGPIQGDMVHPYLRRRNKQEDVDYPSPEIKEILKKTLGVPLFQEQAMEIAIVAAGFTDAEADGLRRSMATFKAKGKVSDWEKKLVSGMIEKGYKEDFARRVFRQLEGFGSYGFPESHAVSFALLVYVSSYLKCYHPDVFACALLNSMPMGFYQPAQIVIDAQKHGVEVRPVDINHSCWDNTLEEKAGPYCVLRLGFRQVKGLGEEDMLPLLVGRKNAYSSIPALMDAGVPLTVLERLADADAFRSIGLDRRQALWEVSALQDRPTGMYEGQDSESIREADVRLPRMSLPEHVVQDYSSMALSLKAHPVSFVREQLTLLQVASASSLGQLTDGVLVRVAGLVLVRQRPGTASGIVFITLEDETGVVNLVVFKKLFDKYRKEILGSKLLMVEGRLQREGEVIHVIVQQCFNGNHLLGTMAVTNEEQSSLLTLSRADEKDADPTRPNSRKRNPRVIQTEIFPDGRNFR
jgi:error-prone DNA polymerase